MENLYQTQQLIIDLRRSKEADAHRYRLVRSRRTPASIAAPTGGRHHGAGFFGRQSLAHA